MASQTTKVRSWLVTAALVGGTAVGAAGIASAATSTKGNHGTKAPATAPQHDGRQAPPFAPNGMPPKGMDPAKLANGPGETLLTGSDAQQVTDAALAAVPGATVIRVETDSDAGGKYEAHLAKSDGTQVTVKLDASFAVTSTEQGFGPGPRGPHGPQVTPPAAPQGSSTQPTA